MLRRTTQIISRKYSRTWQGGLKASFTTNSVGDIVAGRVCTGNTDQTRPAYVPIKSPTELVVKRLSAPCHNVRLPIETSISVTKCTGTKCNIKYEMEEMNINMNNLRHDIGYLHVLLLTNSFSIFITNIALFLTHSH